MVTTDDKGRRAQTALIANDLLTPPPNVGARTTPAYNDAAGKAVSGATSFAALDRYTRHTVFGLASGEAVFAGPREDGFFADTPAIFDLLDPRILAGGLGQAGTGVDGFKGFNVLAYAIQIPLHQLPSLPYQSPFFGSQTGVGVYASVSRPRVTIRLGHREPLHEGPFVQVNRMGNPLFNELLVALKDKDNYNRRIPTEDAAFATYARNPEVAGLINTVFGTSIATMNREDLVAVFIPDVLRVNTATGPVRLSGQPGFSRLGFLGGERPPAPPAAGRTAVGWGTTSSTSRSRPSPADRATRPSRWSATTSTPTIRSTTRSSPTRPRRTPGRPTARTRESDGPAERDRNAYAPGRRHGRRPDARHNAERRGDEPRPRRFPSGSTLGRSDDRAVDREDASASAGSRGLDRAR